MTALGKLWTGAVAYVSLLVGAGLSVAGNLADTYRTRGADVDGLDKVMAAGWPILVLLAIEMFVSPRWSERRMFQAWRWLGCLGVGGMAMTVSWTHLHDLMASRGQLPVVAVLGPLAIDGMAIMATGLILSTRVRVSADTDKPVDADTDKPVDADTDKPVDADMFKSGGYVRTGETDNPWTDTYVPADTDTHTGRDRWADLVSPEDAATVKADADKLNGLATWAQWTSTDDAMVADMKTSAIQIEPSALGLPKRTRTPSGQSHPAEFADMVSAWDPDALPRADMVKLSAAHFDVSTRTTRRWLATLLNEPVSGPPEKS